MGRVAVDAMGGDHAPHEIVLGCARALERSPDLNVLLVGDLPRIEQELPQDVDTSRLELVPAAEIIEMHESPVEAIRRKPDNSIAKAIGLVKQGAADAALSAGNTGGMVAAASFLLPRLPHARRGGIGVPLPSENGACVVMDVGANIQCKPLHLVQYGVMASAYARDVLGVESPRVAVLSVGGEEGKGNSLVKTVSSALKAFDGVNFIGNVEGGDIFLGGADVVICEGFVGNVILKSAQGLSEAFLHRLFDVLGNHLADGEVLRLLQQFRTRTDYAQYGGAPLMGHDGAVFICHGRSGSEAICNAVLKAESFVSHGVNESIARALASLNACEAVADALGSK